MGPGYGNSLNQLGKEALMPVKHQGFFENHLL